jgi:uncharacterized protein YxeA
MRLALAIVIVLCTAACTSVAAKYNPQTGELSYTADRFITDTQIGKAKLQLSDGSTFELDSYQSEGTEAVRGLVNVTAAVLAAQAKSESAPATPAAPADLFDAGEGDNETDNNGGE